MATFSRRHYAAVSPASDTPADIRARKIRQRASELARADREQRYPIITPENFDAANEYQEIRYRAHVAELEEVQS